MTTSILEVSSSVTYRSVLLANIGMFYIVIRSLVDRSAEWCLVDWVDPSLRDS